ncbi:transposase [Stenotrophomonas sp. GD03701]|uniref:transposase n=1 Tax=Stenotrophomonas TaxID=40323 RepID=UPI001CA77999|nr:MULTISPECIES: transposase [Stenotrophomonas]MDH1390148.1 transposase [Stenotrophomonas sp. GD03701]MDH1393811.1 transposase [Stenotrophomonas sp. GD03702]MDQ7273897.1 transposase [Stenotrophomonas sp. Sm3212]
MPERKGSRWALLKDSERWSYKQLCTMHWLQRSGLKTARAWHLKQALRRLYAAGLSPEEADHQLDRWISWALRSRLPPFKRLGATLREHKAGIIEHFRSGLTNASVETMNAQIQAAKARAKGYATHENLIAIAYLLCAKLKHLPRNPWLAPAAA